MLSNEKMDVLVQIRNALLFLVERELFPPGGHTEVSIAGQQEFRRQSAENVLACGNRYGAGSACSDA